MTGRSSGSIVAFVEWVAPGRMCAVTLGVGPCPGETYHV
jgi:hypothetical protein